MISVVIPAFNEEKYIAICLESIKNQKYEDYEIIVVDNASTDKTSEIAKKYADRIIYEPRKGVAIARQSGFSATKGEIIASTDADTIVDKNWFFEIEKSFLKDTVGVYGPVHLMDGKMMENLLAVYLFTFFLKINHFFGNPQFTGMNFAVRKEAFEKVGGFEEVNSAEDVTLSLKLRKIGRINFNPNMLVYTSPRRLKAGYWQFIKHHALNFLSVMLNRKPRDFTDIR